jgi:Domain of unknown function (DUF4878)
MKKIHLLPVYIVLLASSCKSNDKEPDAKSDNNMDAARNFIRAALDGKFDEARTYMLSDSVNINFMDVAERSYQNIDQSMKDSYRSSSIHFHNTMAVSDSASIVVYSNSFKNDHDTLKVLKKGNDWLVDFKYLYEHGADTLQGKPIAKDTLK